LPLFDVALLLQVEALRRSKADGNDEFGRSSFNRFYYSAYLEVRKELGALRAEWFGLKHASIPETLRGTVQKEIKRLLGKANKNGDHQLVQLCLSAKSASLNLADLLEKAYAARVVADYNPEIEVKFSETQFELNDVSVSIARTWPHRASAYMNSIATVWGQIDD
jgi:hypothetical protein